MEHSRLLKFFLPKRDINKMAEPVKVKFDYQDPENVEAEVPGAQKIRESQENGELSKQHFETSEVIYIERSEMSDDGQVVTRHHQTFSGDRNGIQGEAVMDGVRIMEDKDKIEDSKSRTKIPVSKFRQTVEKVKERRGSKDTKEHESHIPVRRSSIPKPVKDFKLPSTVKKEITITKTEIRKETSGPIISSTEIRKETFEPIVTKTEIRKETSEPIITKTEIRKESSGPIISSTEIRKETSEAIVTKTEISEDTNEPTISIEMRHESIETEDEFDKIYAEIVNTPTEVVFDDSLLNSKVEDPEKLESKFEEIIHDYDEHKVEPIDVEVVRRSKIPFLKRKSQQEADLNAQADRTSKIIAARDKIRLRYSLNTSDDFENELDKELKKANFDNAKDKSEAEPPTADTKTEKEIKHEIISSPNFKTETEIEHEVITSPNSKTEVKREFTKTVSTSSNKNIKNDSIASSSVVETTTVNEVTTNESNDRKENKQYMTEENIIKGSIQIGIPVFNSYTHEFSENNETTKTVEVTSVLSYLSQSEDLSINKVTEINKETRESELDTDNSLEVQASNYRTSDTKVNKSFEQQFFKTKEINTDAKAKTIDSKSEGAVDKLEPDDQEPLKHDEVQIRRKVGKVINKTESKELIETEVNKRESINELMKKKSVLTKIAMFERKETEEPVKSVPRKEIKRPNLIIKDFQKEEHVHVHTPLIVDEVFKPFQADINLSNEVNKEEIPVQIDNKLTIVRAESVTVQSSDSVHYAVENKVQIKNTLVEDNNTIEEAVSILQDYKSEEVAINHADKDSEYTVQKVETATITNVLPSEGATITGDITSPIKEFNKPPSYSRVYSNFGTQKSFSEDHQFRNIQRLKSIDGAKLGLTREIQAPVIIPGFKPVSELLRSFESKKDANQNIPNKTSNKVQHTSTVTVTRINPTKTKSIAVETAVKQPEIVEIKESMNSNDEIDVNMNINSETRTTDEAYDNFESIHDYQSLDEVFLREYDFQKQKLRQEDVKRAKSLAEIDLDNAVKGKVSNMILRIKSVDRSERKEVIDRKEMPRKRSVSEKIALFEGKLTSSKTAPPLHLFKYDKAAELRTEQKIEASKTDLKKHSRDIQKDSVAETRKADNEEDKNDEEVIRKKIEELSSAKQKYGTVEHMPGIELANGMVMPVLAVGTALLDPRLIFHIVTAAIDLGYRAIDCAYIYGTEKQVGEAIRAKIADGTVKREDLFVISKLWSTFHRTDLVEDACRDSLQAMGLEYFDLFLIHNPMSFKEGGGPIPKIATVIQYSEFDYLDAWFGMEKVVTKGLARSIGVSNFNSQQLQRVLDKGRVKPVVNQVECHPYLSQQRLDFFCSERNVTLSCFGVLGSKGTPAEMKSGQAAAIDDALVQVMAKGLNVSPGQLLISYQLEAGHGVVVKSSSAHHLWDNLQAINLHLTMGQVDALHALNKNKRTFTFKGMGDTHKNYPFNIAF